MAGFGLGWASFSFIVLVCSFGLAAAISISAWLKFLKQKKKIVAPSNDRTDGVSRTPSPSAWLHSDQVIVEVSPRPLRTLELGRRSPTSPLSPRYPSGFPPPQLDDSSDWFNISQHADEEEKERNDYENSNDEEDVGDEEEENGERSVHYYGGEYDDQEDEEDYNCRSNSSRSISRSCGEKDSKEEGGRSFDEESISPHTSFSSVSFDMAQHHLGI